MPADIVLFYNLIEDFKLDHISIEIKNYEHYIITGEGNYHNTSSILEY